MKSRNKRHEQRIRKLIVMCLFCISFCAISTYAWFIGMKTVNVTTFDVSIAAIDSLSLSLDGEHWSDTVTINESNYNDPTNVYTGNTNSWGGDGLIPMSSVGVIDGEASRLILYEKGSLTTTPGGYRLLATRVHNFVEEGTLSSEQDGYVVFDLFVKNMSGTEYYQELNVLNEEPIYLTVDSIVEVAAAGREGAGIENSVRVAFAQIGRVKANSTASKIIGITCNNDNVAGGDNYDADVTGICSDRTAQIWEPNDVDHVQNAINWYTTSCAARTGANVTAQSSYNENYGTCNAVVNGTSYETYAVSGRIDVEHNVDVYDGNDYNTYNSTVATTPTAGKLMYFDTFTDTEKNLNGVERPTFMTLAPNSVTKVRVYVYIEGQDVDNYDFASLGKRISVAFGFTKERFFDVDVDYDDTNTATLPADVVKENHPDQPYNQP